MPGRRAFWHRRAESAARRLTAGSGRRLSIDGARTEPYVRRRWLARLPRAPRSGRRRWPACKEQDATGFAAGVRPGMRDVAGHKGAGTGAAGADFVADLEGELPFEHPGDLVAVMVQMVEASGAERQRLLAHHDALAGLAPEQLHREEAAGGRAVETPTAARRYDKAFCCGHARSSFPATQRV